MDLIIVATSTPDYVFPSTACLLQAKLGVKGSAAFDVQAVCSGFVYGLATAFYGASIWFGVSLIFLAFIGAADATSAIVRNTVRQLATPDNLRGRVQSLNMMFVMGGPQLGNLCLERATENIEIGAVHDQVRTGAGKRDLLLLEVQPFAS